MRATSMKLQPGTHFFLYRERGIDLRANYALLTSFPELVHVNFSIIVDKILGLGLFLYGCSTCKFLHEQRG